MAKSVRRLYSGFHPDSYTLDLELDPKAMAIKGQLIIDGQKVGRSRKRLTLHQKNIKISDLKVIFQGAKGSEQLTPTRIVYQKSYDEVRFHFNNPLPNGHYRLELNYQGRINKQLHGAYLSTYTAKGQTKTIICSQLESHHAREVLPCIDEPEAKSVFNLTLRTPLNLSSVISNSQVLTTETRAGRRLTKFAPTPKMSSYLLAFVVGELKYLEARTKHNVVVRTYATPDNVKYTQFALECAAATLDYYDEYFALPYPLTKCDLVALPDFASGAMENWGCITFREQALIVNPKTTSLDVRQYVANVIAHELTHQWFGNLVTMRWWNDLWLNESFASWMSYLAVDHLFPDWQVWTQFVVDEQSGGLKQDSLEHTHPIEVKINNPDEIRVAFDAISYEKGAAIITMLHDYLGAETFRDGIRLYLSLHTYGSTTTADLWQALETVADKPVANFMHNWTTLSGYPLLKAAYTADSLHLQQQRFYLNPLATRDSSIWPIPLFSSLELTKNDPFGHRSLNLVLNSPPDSLLLNKGRRGFYRVIYDEKSLDSLMSSDFNQRVEAIDRYGLIADAFEATKAGFMPTNQVLRMLEYYNLETNLVVWEAVAGGLGSLRSVMDDEELRNLMNPFIRQLVAAEIERLGLAAKASDNHFDKLLRPVILGLAAVAEEPRVLLEAKRLFYEQPDNIDPDLSGLVYSTIARHGQQTDFETLLKMHQASGSSEERLKLAAALTNFKQPKLIDQSLELFRGPDIRLQDVVYWISYSFANHYARDATWQWLKDNWQWLADNMDQDLSFYRMPFYAARYYSSEAFLADFRQFFEARLSVAFDRPLKQAIETITWQAKWKERELESTKAFFGEWSKAQPM